MTLALAYLVVKWKIRMVALKITEREFMEQVMELARLYRWKVYHTHDSRRSQPGWPDLAMARVGRGRNLARLILAELKSPRGKLTAEQSEWLAVLGQVPSVEAYCWRPADWNEIVSILK